jgi:transposase-like protein
VPDGAITHVAAHRHTCGCSTSRQARRLSDLDAVVLSLSAKGLTHGEISAHFVDVYGASVSEDVVGRITDRVDSVV